jgi:hypothetical protein
MHFRLNIEIIIILSYIAKCKMSEQVEFSFAGDNRNIQGSFLNYSSAPSSNLDTRALTKSDVLAISVSNAIKDKLGYLEPQVTKVLMSSILENIPLEGKNIAFIVVASYVMLLVNQYNEDINDPAVVNHYFTSVASLLMGDIDAKDQDRISIIRAKFKVSFIRYLRYVRKYLL